jgi:DNA-binding CsgD family transcriptional regulator
MASSLAACAGEYPAESLVEMIYATIGDDGRWQPLLRRLCEDFASRCGALARYDFGTNTGEVLYQAPPNAPLTSVYAHRGAVNPWFLSRQYYAAGQVIAGHDIISRDEFLRTDFYREVLRPHGLFHRLCGVLSRTSDQILYVVMHRRKEQEDYGDAEQRRLAALVPHLARALAITARLRAGEKRTRLLSGIISSQLPRLFVVDATCMIVYAGAPAAAVAPVDCTLQEHLGLSAPKDRSALAKLLHALADAQSGMRIDGVHRLRAWSEPQRCWMRLSLRRLWLGHTGVDVMPPLFTVTVENPQEDEAEALRDFARHFALSPAQSRVSALILKGHSPISAATALHLSANTVRSHLKQIFLKTNTHRQVELISLLKQLA